MNPRPRGSTPARRQRAPIPARSWNAVSHGQVIRDDASMRGSIAGVRGALLVGLVFDRELLDFFADDRTLFVLDTDGAVWRTTDLAHWSRVAVVTGFRPQSLALLDGMLYVGTRN